MHAFRPQRGFTLVEILVALVIFAFGLLASVGLLLSSMQATQYSSNSVVASTMAREYAELMQMIPGGVSGTSSATSSSANTLMVDTDGITSGNASACTGADKNCSATDLLAAARDDWALRVKSTQALPQGRAVVCRDATPRNAAGELEWGGCDEAGDTVLVKMGWLGKKPVGSDSGVDTRWMTSDRPRFAVSVMGNLRDYVTPPAAGATP